MTSDVFAAAESMSGAFGSVDWTASAIGPPGTWSPTLHGALGLVLPARHPVALLWGPELVFLYNAAYVPLIGHKHPRALGRPAHEVFPEAWDVLSPLLGKVLAGRGAVWVQDTLVPLERSGFLEECYFTFSFSPVHGPDGAVEGIVDIASETTREVLARRRLELLGRLHDRLEEVDDPDHLLVRGVEALRSERHPDLPALDVRVPGDPRLAGPEANDLPPRPRSPLAGRDVAVEQRDGRTVVWLPLRAGASEGDDSALLVVALNERLPADDAYLSFLQLVAAALTRAMHRMDVLALERDAALNHQQLSETLQRSLLSPPPQPEHLAVAVRYIPAAYEAQVGGDWYDAFLVGDGGLTLAIGDVTGHDREAVAVMAQTRSLLRGIAYTLQEPPGLVLAALDDALDGLGVDTLISAVLARVEQAPDQRDQELRTLRWSNAGHLPPVMVQPDGTAHLLESDPEPLLGLQLDVVRTDHETLLRPGSTVVFYTDGLIERRGAPLSDGLAWLTDTLAGQSHLTAEQVCDLLIAHVPDRIEDDVALLVLRVHAT